MQEDDDGSDEARSGLLQLMTMSNMMGSTAGSALNSMINPGVMGIGQLIDSKECQIIIKRS